ncbi:hypothetical protein [Amycolatopsis sp. NPDC059657]|uniref:hypothetical protein n=1 Tax=Amycolatopsis sp. NPDC059657 TaxID=3346899 RepID=UPI00366CF334
MTADTAGLLADLRSTTEAVKNQDWVAAGLGGASTALDLLGPVPSPLSAIAGAGFGMVMDLVSFLEEPLKQLEGDPSPVSSNSRSLHGAGQNLDSAADSYRESADQETTGWSGGAGANYRDTSKKHADGIKALGQASTAVSHALSGAGQVVARVTELVTGLITEAAGKIIPIMTQAVAAAPATFGASVAAAIPQIVQIAVEYGQKIAEKMGTLLASSDNLLRLLQAVLGTVEAVTTALTQLSGGAKGDKVR